MVGEKREEWAYLISFCLRKTLLPLLNTTLVHSPRLGNPLPHSWPNHWHSLAGLWESTLSHSSPNHLLCRYVFKRSVNETFNHKIPIIHCVILESVLTATFLQLELWFRVVGLPATGRFLSTSAHYLESWLRNRQYRGVCMHQWQVSRLRRQFSSLTCDRRIPWNVRHRLIHSHLMDCAGYFENHWNYWWSLSRLLTVYIIDR